MAERGVAQAHRVQVAHGVLQVVEAAAVFPAALKDELDDLRFGQAPGVLFVPGVDDD